MLAPSFPSCRVPESWQARLLGELQQEFSAVWGPVSAADGSCRLQPLNDPGPLPDGARCRLPVKKLLLPPGAAIWSWAGDRCEAPPPPGRVAVVGLPLCELQAVWYLDRVFATDADYGSRRDRLFLIGAPCTPGDDCRCLPTMPLAGDLFLDRDRVWLLSAAAAGWFEASPESRSLSLSQFPLPWPEPSGTPTPPVSAEIFQSLRQADVWQREGRKCLSCGACSALCPTCYCFDLQDRPALDGRVERLRTWDNCFFPEHGQVAGGHDFRPDRVARLRFRFEHKRLGFGDLRGLASCVGCGRCRDACPVAIDLDGIAEELRTEARR